MKPTAALTLLNLNGVGSVYHDAIIIVVCPAEGLPYGASLITMLSLS